MLEHSVWLCCGHVDGKFNQSFCLPVCMWFFTLFMECQLSVYVCACVSGGGGDYDMLPVVKMWVDDTNTLATVII